MGCLRHYNNKMIKLPKKITDFMDVFEKHGYAIYLVGGAIRNILLKKEVTNWDFTTSATPNEIINMFPKSFYHNEYGTVSIPQDENKSIFEVTPFRKESDYSDNRHPKTISWAKTIKEDLSRRDFTINAIAYGNNKVVDLYDGQKHLKEKIIKTVGDPDIRFKEDALRLLRAIRFSSQLGFLLDENTKQSIQRNSLLIKNISFERIRDEFLKILESDYPSEGVIFLKNTGLLTHILPELDICFIIPQKSPKRHHIYDVGTHQIMALKNCPSKDPITRFACLIHDIGKAETFKKDETGLITFYNHEVVGTKLTKIIADRFKLSNDQKEKLIQLVKYHQFTVSEIQTDKAVRRFIKNIGKKYINDMLDVRTGDRIGSGATPTSWRLELFKKRLIDVQKQPFSISDLKIDGNDIMKALKIKPGPKVGQILKKLFDQVLEKKLDNDKKSLLKAIEVSSP